MDAEILTPCGHSLHGKWWFFNWSFPEELGFFRIGASSSLCVVKASSGVERFGVEDLGIPQSAKLLFRVDILRKTPGLEPFPWTLNQYCNFRSSFRPMAEQSKILQVFHAT